MDNIIVVLPRDYKPEPKDCPICNLAFKFREDVINYRVHGCCESCDLIYRYPNKEKWESGWRPQKEVLSQDN